MSEAPSAEDASKTLQHLGETVNEVVSQLLERGVGLSDALSIFETCFIRAAVARQGGNVSQAAAVLGIHRNTLRAKLQRTSSLPGQTRD